MQAKLSREKIQYDPIEIGEGVFWVGFYDKPSGLHCNPYLIMEGDEAVLIDGGSRPDFPVVMMKILKTGISPKNIKALIYQHYDPDLCGSIPNLENMIESPDLKLVSNPENIMFLRHYGSSSTAVSLKSIDYVFRFKSGREILFFNTPYAHSAGSFITFDKKSEILFTSDLFGSYGDGWELFFEFAPQCIGCDPEKGCVLNRKECGLKDIKNFHKKIMTSERSLRYAMEVVSKIPFKIIAPQHGSIIRDEATMVESIKVLRNLKDVGIDAFLKGVSYEEIGNIDSLDKRFVKGGR